MSTTRALRWVIAVGGAVLLMWMGQQLGEWWQARQSGGVVVTSTQVVPDR